MSNVLMTANPNDPAETHALAKEGRSQTLDLTVRIHRSCGHFGSHCEKPYQLSPADIGKIPGYFRDLLSPHIRAYNRRILAHLMLGGAPVAPQTLVVNPQGCGVKLSRALAPGTRVLLDGLPGGVQATARVANCLPLGTDGRNFLLGLALENPGNVWGIAKPPADWNDDEPLAAVEDPVKKKNWPYSLFSAKGEAHPGRR